MSTARISGFLINEIVQLLCVGCMLGTSSCSHVSKAPSGPAVIVHFNWQAWARATPADSARLSVGGSLFETTLGKAPDAGVQAVNRRMDDKQYFGVLVFGVKDHDSPVVEVFIHGEENRVLIRAKSEIPFVIEPTDYAGKRLTWIVSSAKMEGPLDLPPGEHQIEVVATDDRPHTSPK